MKQLNVSLTDPLRDQLEASSAKAGRSLGTEIRERLQESFFWEQFDPQTRRLAAQVADLAVNLKIDTGCHWHSHAGANYAFRQGVVSLLRGFGQPPGEPSFAPDELPAQRLVYSDDPTTIGIGLAAIVALNRPLTDEEQRDLQARDARRKEETEQTKRGEGPVSSLFEKPGKPKGE